MLRTILLFFIFTYFSFPVANGELQCFSCVMHGGETDRSCLTNPADVVTSHPTVICPHRFCRIQRQEFLDHPGQIVAFHRGCSDIDNSGVTEGGGFRVFNRVCTTNLCNDWDGIAPCPPDGGSGGGCDGGDGGDSGGSGDNELKCYSCQMHGGETDRSCLTNPAGVVTSPPTVICPHRFCTIQRHEYLDHPGQIVTFHRGCSDIDNSGITESGGFRVFNRVCTTNLCNDWDGIAPSPPDGGPGGGGDDGGGDDGGGDDGGGDDGDGGDDGGGDDGGGDGGDDGDGGDGGGGDGDGGGNDGVGGDDGSGGGGGGGSGGSGGNGSGSRTGYLIVGGSVAGNRRVDVFFAFIIFSVVMTLFR